jgi:hypothetical protein
MKPLRKRTNVLFMPFMIMTISIITLSLLSYFLVTASGDALRLNTNVIKIISRQRSLSQEIVNSIAADNLEGKLTGPPLRGTINSFSHLQVIFLHGDSSLDISPLKQHLYAEYHQLDIAYINFFKALQRNIANDGAANFIDLLNAQDLYLQQLDNFNTKLNGYSNKQINTFELREMCILLGSLAIIFLEIVFIFFPAIRKINGQNTTLKEIAFSQSHLVRRPLANIQGLLAIILDSKENYEEIAYLIKLTKNQADVLDTVIKENIYKSAS